MSRYTAEHLTIIILTNRALCRTERMAHTVAGLIEPSLQPYAETNKHPDAHPQLTTQFRRFLSSPAADGALLSDAARPRLVPSTLNTLRRELRELGPVRRYSLVRSVTSGSQLQRVYRVEGDDMVDFFTVTYGPGLNIDDLDLFREF